MKDALVSWRIPICLIAFIAASALPAAAQPRDLAHVDQAVTDQQAQLQKLTTSVADLQKENADLRQTLNDINKKTAPPEAWKALGWIGSIFVGAWAAVTLARDWPSKRAADAEMQLKIRTGIDHEAKSIESAVDARMKTVFDLLRELRPQAVPPAPGKGIPE